VEISTYRVEYQEMVEFFHLGVEFIHPYGGMAINGGIFPP
jgi:hypothetical protein